MSHKQRLHVCWLQLMIKLHVCRRPTQQVDVLSRSTNVMAPQPCPSLPEGLMEGILWRVQLKDMLRLGH